MELYDQIIEKMKKSAHEMKDSIPYIAYHSIYNDMQTKDIGWWTNSFYAGILWYLYLETSDDVYMQYAKSIEQKLDIVLNEGVEVDHDAGFMWTLTSKINYLLTKNEQSKSKTITAANYLVNRFEKGDYIRAWNGDWAKGYAIIDTMMNLSLLYFVSQETGDLSYKNIAIKCADTVLKHFIRSDGSVRHIVVFNTETGEVEDYRVGQGYHIDSSWGRGTAWAFYGLAITYRETKDKKYLQAANQISDFIKAHNSKIFVPYADYLAPNETKKKYDSSAGAITLCGYYLFYQLTKDKTFLDYGNKILNGLTKHCLTDLNDQPLLKHGNVSYHTEKMEESDCSLIYGDYFFMEALRLLNKKVTFF